MSDHSIETFLFDKFEEYLSTTKFCTVNQDHGDHIPIESIADQDRSSKVSTNEHRECSNSPSEQFDQDSTLKQEQRLPIDPCEYEIDLGNGQVTKSISNYRLKDKQSMQTTSVLSADSIPNVNITKLPFTSECYTGYSHSYQPSPVDAAHETNILFNARGTVTRRKAKFPFRLVTVFSIGTPILIFMIVLIFLVF